MNTQATPNGTDAHPRASTQSVTFLPTLRNFFLSGLALLALGLLATPAGAQSFIRFKAGQLRITVPLNSTTSTVITNTVTLGGFTSGTGATLSVTGLPPGAGYLLSTNPDISSSSPVLLTVNTTNVAEGVYTFSLNGSGTDSNSLPVTNNIFFTLQVGYLWNGGTNLVVNGPGFLTNASLWLGGLAPGVLDDIIFTDLGGQTNSTNILSGGLLAPNIIIGSSVTNASVRFAQTNTDKFYTIQITNGTWTLNGANGFSFLRDYVDNTLGIGQGMTVTVFGSGGAMAVQNEQANFSLLIDNGIANLLDMSQLDNFSTDVNQISLGDYLQYPNFFNLETNNYGGIPRQFLGSWNLAKTNMIKAIFADPFNYTNANRREYSLSFMNSELTGSSTAPIINMGISNSFLLDSVCFIGGNSRGNVQFNPALHVTTNVVAGVTNLVTNTMAAYFRGTNGGRMSMFCVADGGGTNTANSNIKTTVDFSTQGGVLNVLADRFIIGRDRQLIVTNGTPNYQGFLTMGKGIIDVNTAIFGFREHYQTNTTPPTFPTVPSFNGYCEGKFTIASNGVLKVNNTLTLGSTVADMAVQLGSGGNTEYGEVIVQNGGSLIANQINVGGPVYGSSKNNFIIISNNCSLVLSNTLAGPQQSLDTLLMNNSTLTLNLDGTNTNPYVYVTNLVTTGTNAIIIASIKHLSSITGNIQLVQYSAGNGSFQTLVMPPGLGGALITTNNQGIFLSILTNAPKNLLWRGYASSDWDLVTPNWLDMVTGLHTNFANGDFAFFDDDGTTPTTVHLGGSIDIIPGSISMTNNANYYIIDGASGGDIQGSANFSKYGTNGLEIDGPTTVSVLVNQGYLVGSGGAIGSATVAAAASMNYAGGVINGITTASTNTTYSGTGGGNLIVQSTGTLTNSGTFNGSFSIAAGAVLYNTGSIGTSATADYTAVGNPVVVSNATFINSGDIHALTLTIGGTFEDKGTGTIYINGDVPTGARGVTINLGGMFIPGGDGIGTTTITADGSSKADFPGRLLFGTGSTNVFKIDRDPGSAANTQVQVLGMGFGPNESIPANNGGTLRIENVGTTAFAAGDSFFLVQEVGGGDFNTAGLNTTNAIPIIDPISPGPGLAWDLSGIILHGRLGVVAVNTNSTTFTLSTSPVALVTTNSSGTPTATNTGTVFEFRWPADHIGWELQSQSTLTNLVSTNWTSIAGTSFVNDFFITNIIGTNAAATYFRMIYP